MAPPERIPEPRLFRRPRAPAGIARASSSVLLAAGRGAENAGEATERRARETMTDLAYMFKDCWRLKGGLKK
jgi:hypothetical protein